MPLPNLGLIGDIADHAIWNNSGRSNTRMLDALVMGSVIDQRNAPPGSPADGDRHLVGAIPSGIWATDGAANKVAAWNAALSQFDYYTAKHGWEVFNEELHGMMRFSEVSGKWHYAETVINVKDFGAVGDGVTDDTTAVYAAIGNAMSNASGACVYFPHGTYLLTTWSVLFLTQPVWLRGDGMGQSVLKATTATDFVSVQANFRCDGLTFDTWSMVFDFSGVGSVLDTVTFDDVEIKNYLRGIWCSTSTPAVGLRNLRINRCRLSTGRKEAISLQCAIQERWHVTNNTILDSVLRGIVLGNNTATFADARGMYLISGNIIDVVTNEIGVALGVTADNTTEVFTTASAHSLAINDLVMFDNSGGALPTGLLPRTTYFVRSTPTATTFTLSATSSGPLLTISDNGTGTHAVQEIVSGGVFGILCYGWRAIITENYVSNLKKHDPTASDVDGIYTKCRYSIISNNVCINASQAESSINVKGGAKGETVIQPHGYSVTVANNQIIDTSTLTRSAGGKRSSGIKIATSEVMVVGNTLEGLAEIGIYTDSDTGSDAPCHNITIAGNLIKNHRGKTGIAVYGRGDHIRILNNVIDGILSTYEDVSPPQPFGILMTKKGGQDIDISGNRVSNVASTGSTPVGIGIKPSPISVTSVHVTVDAGTNVFTGVTPHGFAVGKPVKFTGSALPSPLVAGTTYYIESVPTADSFKIAASVGGGAIDVGAGTVETVAQVLSNTVTLDNTTDIFTTPTGHGLAAGDAIKFSTDNTLPAGITEGAIYYVLTAATATTFTIAATPGGAQLLFTDNGTGTHTVTQAVMITAATSDLITSSTAHGLLVGDAVAFSTSSGGTLPAGMTPGVVYYVTTTPSLLTFTISTVPLGTTLDITGTGTGTHLLLLAFVGIRVSDNHVDGARYGVHFSWTESQVLMDDVLTLHNTGRNINSTALPALTDIVKYSDTPTHLLNLPAETPTVYYELSSRAAISQPSGAENPQELRVYRNKIDTSNYERITVRAKSSAMEIITEFGGSIDIGAGAVTAAKRALELRVAQTSLTSGGALGWRVSTSGNLEPLTADALFLGSASLPVSGINMSGELNLARSAGDAKVVLPGTTAGAAGAVTINKICGRVLIASGATSVVLTSNKLSATSKTFCQIAAADTNNPRIKSVVYSASGGAHVTITLDTAPAADLPIDFLIMNIA